MTTDTPTKTPLEDVRSLREFFKNQQFEFVAHEIEPRKMRVTAESTFRYKLNRPNRSDPSKTIVLFEFVETTDTIATFRKSKAFTDLCDKLKPDVLKRGYIWLQRQKLEQRLRCANKDALTKILLNLVESVYLDDTPSGADASEGRTYGNLKPKTIAARIKSKLLVENLVLPELGPTPVDSEATFKSLQDDLHDLSRDLSRHLKAPVVLEMRACMGMGWHPMFGPMRMM